MCRSNRIYGEEVQQACTTPNVCQQRGCKLSVLLVELLLLRVLGNHRSLLFLPRFLLLERALLNFEYFQLHFRIIQLFPQLLVFFRQLLLSLR